MAMARIGGLLRTAAISLLLLAGDGHAAIKDPEFERLEAKRQPLVTLFKQEQFDSLDEKLNAIQAQYESGQIDEEELVDYFQWIETLGNLDVDGFDRRLTMWVEQKPESYAANLARGIFYAELGYKSRGVKFASETTTAQFSKMRSWFKRSKKDLRLSLTLTAKPLLSHFYLNVIALFSSDRAARETYFSEAMQYAPDSNLMRGNYMVGLLPRWGGSIEQMEAFARESEALLGRGDVVGSLRNRIRAERAQPLLEAERYAEARALLTEGLEQRDSTQLSCMRVHANAFLDKFDEAVSDLEASTKNTSPHHYCAEMVAWFTEFASHDSRVVAVLSAYVARNPDHVLLRTRRGALRQERGDLAGAFRDYELSAKLGDPSAKMFVGQFLVNGWGGVEKDYERALAYLREAADTGEPYAKQALNEVLQMLGLEAEEAARQQARARAMQRMRPLKSTWDMKKDEFRWGAAKFTDHRVLATILGGLIMGLWMRRERRSI